MLNIKAKIKNISYTPTLPSILTAVSREDFSRALSDKTRFLLNYDHLNTFAISQWVSPKRTRSYPYSRVYDTLKYSGKKVTIIPVMKDEGLDGDRDFIQWDTLSLMSLMDVYVILTYYNKAIKSPRYKNKIKDQNFDFQHILEQFESLSNYRSSALHWNLNQTDQIGSIGIRALAAYNQISIETGVSMHNPDSAKSYLSKISKSADEFKNISRSKAQEAQLREANTIQPKENLSSQTKSRITIENYLGGAYFFTVDEIEVINDTVLLIEAKHSQKSKLPSNDDIKDGLLTMILFTNLEDITVSEKAYKHKSILKLSSATSRSINDSEKLRLIQLQQEAETNNFTLRLDFKQ